jgi:hypothetical protein
VSARTAFENRYDLYELAVQEPAREARFLEAVHGGGASCLAEDFSGPASICRAWLAMGAQRTAIATDRDPEPLEHCVRRLTEQHGRDAVDRLTISTSDVLAAGGASRHHRGVNFACCELHERERLVTYFRHALFRLNQGGVLVVDTYGGENAFASGVSVVEIDTDEGTVVYEWEQAGANPLTGRVSNAIHFTTPDGARMEHAFVYDWRLWSVPELREAMREAGFASTEVHASMGGAETGEGELVVRPIDVDGEGETRAWPEGLDESYVVFVVGRV